MSKRKTRHLLLVRCLNNNKVLAVNTVTNKYTWADTTQEAIKWLSSPGKPYKYNGNETCKFVMDWAKTPSDYAGLTRICI